MRDSYKLATLAYTRALADSGSPQLEHDWTPAPALLSTSWLDAAHRSSWAPRPVP